MKKAMRVSVNSAPITSNGVSMCLRSAVASDVPLKHERRPWRFHGSGGANWGVGCQLRVDLFFSWSRVLSMTLESAMPAMIQCPVYIRNRSGVHDR